jgi:hypothetical protein
MVEIKLERNFLKTCFLLESIMCTLYRVLFTQASDATTPPQTPDAYVNTPILAIVISVAASIHFIILIGVVVYYIWRKKTSGNYNTCEKSRDLLLP